MSCDVVLLPSFTQVEWWRKRQADKSSSGVFSQVVSTFDAWVADLWELHGDGRLPVGGMQRDMLMHAAADAVADSGRVRSLASAAAECMRLAAGLEEFEDVVAVARHGSGSGGLSPREREFARMMARYEDLLAERGLVEAGQAALALARDGRVVFPQGACVRMPMAAPLTWVQERFFGTCGELELVIEPAAGSNGVGRVPSGVEVRFGCPSGALAEPGLVADVIEEYGAGASVVVACKDPLGLYGRLEKRFGASRQMCVQARKPFAQTDFGRAFIACYRCLNDEPWDPAFLSDALSSPFSGMSRAQAVRFDTRLRADRLARRGDVLQELRAGYEEFSQLEELASDPDADVLVAAFEQRVRADARRPDAWRAEQLAALGLLRDTMEAARMAGVGMDACLEALGRASVPVAVRGDGAGARVLVTTQSIAAQLEPGGFDVAVVADLTSECYPVADRDDAASTFLSKMGLEPPEPALGRARREFCALLSLPTDAVVLVRPLGDANADETYPAAVLEEFIDAYRSDPSDTGAIDNEYRLPDFLQAGLVERGEELLFANAQVSAIGRRQQVAQEVPWPDMAGVDAASAGLVLPTRCGGGADAPEKACPSPSQIELYLECPFKWFAERRMHLDTVDEGFGPIERGSFAHAALEEFYRRFQASGHLKVGAENLDVARALMREVADGLASRQCEEDPGERYAAATELERREVAALCNQLVAYLDFEARLLPAFHPAFLEYEIDVDHAVEFAGHAFVGKVDRIDVDDAGRAVIVDYKGSVGEEHEIAGKGWARAGKVQTRMYARAVERALGLDVVGAVYVSYGARPASAGAYDPRVLEAAHLPGMRHERCACGLLEEVPDPPPEDYSLGSLTFDRVLDETEAIAGAAISAMAAGEVDPRPASDGACRYCPVLSCPKRGE